MSPRAKRAARLVDLAEKALDSARNRAAAAERATTEAQAEAEQAERVWVAATHGFAKGVVSVEDLSRQGAHLRTLRTHADIAIKRLEKARADEKTARELVLEASRERQKLELWRERLREVEREEEARIEQLATDELAARTTRART